MAEEVLTAEPRAERGSRPAGRLRRAGLVPAVVYGLGGDRVTVTVPSRELTHILAHGANTLIRLRLAGDDQLTLARQVQRDPTRGDLVHIDFVRVRTDVAVSAEHGLIHAIPRLAAATVHADPLDGTDHHALLAHHPLAHHPLAHHPLAHHPPAHHPRGDG